MLYLTKKKSFTASNVDTYYEYNYWLLTTVLEYGINYYYC